MNTVVVGSTLKGLEAAMHYASIGHKVTVLCEGTYLGEDVTGTWRYYPQNRQAELIQHLKSMALRFGQTAPNDDTLTPGNVKRLLVTWMQKSGITVHYLTRLFGVQCIQNQITGVVAADKAGLYSIPCTLAIDATLYQQASMLLSGKVLHLPQGHQLTLRLELRNVACDKFPLRLDACDAVLLEGLREDQHTFIEAVRTLPHEMTAPQAHAWALSQMKSLLEGLRHAPQTQGAIPGETLPGAIDIAPPTNTPQAQINGWLAADLSMLKSPTTSTHCEDESEAAKLLVNGTLLAFTVAQDGTVSVDWETLPHITTDVLVAGTGTSGVWATLSAARAGAKVCAVEMMPYPGGTRAMGGVNSLYYGNRNQLFQNMWAEIKDYTNLVMGQQMTGMHHILEIMYIAEQMQQLGVSLFSSTLVCGTQLDADANLQGVLCCGSQGVFVITAKRSIDATGDGDIAALAGCSFAYGDEQMNIMQNYSQWNRCALNRRGYRATDQDTMDQTQRKEWTRALEWNLQSLVDYDMFDLLTVREGRRIQGRSMVTMRDAVRGKRTPDIIHEAYCTYDPHGRGMDINGRLGLMPAQGNPMFVAIPLGALLPKGINQLMVVGKAISMDQDAFNYIRMNADVMCVGWVAGYLSAQSIQLGINVEACPLTALQTQLRQMGALTLPAPAEPSYATSPDRIVAEILTGEQSGFRNAVLCQWGEVGTMLARAYDMACFSSGELIEKTLLWFGDLRGAENLTALLKQTNARIDKANYIDRQRADGFVKAGIVGEIDDAWRLNQLVILLSRAGYAPAKSVILDVLCNTGLGGGWENNTTAYASVRLDCQSVPNYDRILCLAHAATLMPSQRYQHELVRLYDELEHLPSPPAPFYKEYLQARLCEAMLHCKSPQAREYLNQLTCSRYHSIAAFAIKLLEQ